MKRLSFSLAIGVGLALSLPSVVLAASSGSYDLGRQHILYVTPDHPRATIVMLPGGSGDIGLEPDGSLRHGDNFVVRTRALWVAKGYAVLIPDAVDGANLRGLRSSPQYVRLVADLIAFAKAQFPVPVFLLGTSQGSIAAVNGAAHAAPGAVAGVVLTESVSRLGGSHETVFDADPQSVRVPALIVANRDDACPVAPPGDAAKIAAALTHARSVQVLSVSGGVYQSKGPCESLTPHGYDGIEPQVIDAIDRWMRAQG
jgi:pimeloyl-ACP methyl ester carboxylesterase